MLTFATLMQTEHRVRLVSVPFIILGTSLLFGFIGVKTVLVYQHGTAEIKIVNGDRTSTKTENTAEGEIKVEVMHEMKDGQQTTDEQSERTSPYEVLALALFSLSITCYTVAFAALGNHSYRLSRTDQEPQVAGAPRVAS